MGNIINYAFKYIFDVLHTERILLYIRTSRLHLVDIHSEPYSHIIN